MCLAKEFWEGKQCWKGYRRHTPRDKVAVEGETVRYLLWDNQVATWNKKNNTLMIDDCGYKTWLTFNRLNAILGETDAFIHSERGKIYIRDSKKETDYVWEGSHLLKLEPFEITPRTPRKTNKKVSKALRNYYAKATELLEKRKRLVTSTLDGTACLFPRRWYGSRFSMSVLSLYVCGDNVTAYTGRIANSKVYSAFMKNDAASLAGYLVENGSKLEESETIPALERFDVDVKTLPKTVVQQIALMKLLEA